MELARRRAVLRAVLGWLGVTGSPESAPIHLRPFLSPSSPEICQGARRTRPSKHRLRARLLLLTALYLNGCSTAAPYRPLIDKFSAAVDQTAGVAETYLADLNALHHRLQVAKALAERQGISQKELAAPFDPEALRARVEAVSVLGAYGRALAGLARAGPAEEAAVSVRTLVTRLDGLATTVKTLDQKTVHQPPGAKSIGDYHGPLGALFALFAKLHFQRLQEREVRTAITQSKPEVNGLVDLLKDDLGAIYKYRLATLSSILRDHLRGYNAERASMSAAERRSALQDIERLATEADVLAAAEPVRVLESLGKAHLALSNYAASPKDPNTIQELAAAVEIFSAVAEHATQTIRAFRDRPWPGR